MAETPLSLEVMVDQHFNPKQEAYAPRIEGALTRAAETEPGEDLLTPGEFASLALACLDQAGASAQTQKAVGDAIRSEVLEDETEEDLD